jgi:hypothetical protein
MGYTDNQVAAKIVEVESMHLDIATSSIAYF